MQNKERYFGIGKFIRNFAGGMYPSQEGDTFHIADNKV